MASLVPARSQLETNSPSKTPHIHGIAERINQVCITFSTVFLDLLTKIVQQVIDYMWIILIKNLKELQTYFEAKAVMTVSPYWSGGIKYSWASNHLGIHVNPDGLLEDVRL